MSPVRSPCWSTARPFPPHPRSAASTPTSSTSCCADSPAPARGQSVRGHPPLAGRRTAQAADHPRRRRRRTPDQLRSATTHILKPEPQAFPGLVDNEWYCMTLAAAIGLRVAEVRKEVSVSGLPYLVVQRYDRDQMADAIRRLHQEDFCQALGVPSAFKYQAEGGPGVSDAIALLRKATAAPVIELPRFWDALVFNWLIGNCDAHGKNYSLLYDAGAPTLAPLYDLVSTVVYPELVTRLAMSIDGATQIGDVDATRGRSLPRRSASGATSPPRRFAVSPGERQPQPSASPQSRAPRPPRRSLSASSRSPSTSAPENGVRRTPSKLAPWARPCQCCSPMQSRRPRRWLA